MFANMSFIITINQSESTKQIARKIYERFDVGAFCSIFGFEEHPLSKRLVPKGELVLEELKELDEEEHMRYAKSKRYRQYKYKPGSIGGPIAQKIFTYDKKIVDKEPRITIWRYQ